MARYSKVAESADTWRLLDHNGQRIGRIWLNGHVDRIIRDGDLAEAVLAAIQAGGTAANRRTAVRAAIEAWRTAGGRSVNFSNVTMSLNNDAGVEDGNRHIYIAGNELGYLHGTDTGVMSRLARFVRLANELADGEDLGTAGQRNAALDAAVTRFTNDGGLD